MPTTPTDARLLGVIAVGGGLGSLTRYGVGLAWPASGGGLPWSTLAVNLSGSFLLGMLVVAVTERWRPHRLLRPALGTGLLGGYTTFSTFAVQLRESSIGVGAAYLMLSVVGGVTAAVLGMALVRGRFGPPPQLEPLDPDLA